MGKIIQHNQSSGLPWKNTTHIDESEASENQQEIVDAILADRTKKGTMTISLEYKDYDPLSPPPLAGIMKIREMIKKGDQETIVNFGKTLMRTRPNVIGVHIKLGNYPNQKEIQNTKTKLLNSRKPRHPSEVGEKIGSILGDELMNVTELWYQVQAADAGNFRSVGKVMHVPLQEDLMDDDLFEPTITLTFIKNT